MPELSRSQLLVYGAIAVAVLLIGARWIRSSGGGSTRRRGAELRGRLLASETEGSRDVVVHVAGAVGGRASTGCPPARGSPTRSGGRAASPDGANRGRNQPGGPAQRRTAGGGPRPAACRPRRRPTGGQTGPISLGSATVEQLDEIEGIGPVTAQKIIEFRDQHGGLSSVNQLDQVDGIGPSTMETLRAALQP